MITKEKTLLMLLLVLSTLTASADIYDDYPGYQGYKNAYKEWLGVDISIPLKSAD